MNTPTPETDEIEAERDKAITLLRHFITHYEVLDYSEATLDELEKIAVGLWGVVKERDQLKERLNDAKAAYAAIQELDKDLAEERDQLREVADELAKALALEMNPGFSCQELRDYNQLPHVIERNTK